VSSPTNFGRIPGSNDKMCFTQALSIKVEGRVEVGEENGVAWINKCRT
jgi:hypothetical protein